MAKRTKSRALALRPFTMSTPKPIVLRQTKVIHAKSKHKKHHRHHGGLRGLTDPARLGIVIGGAAVGFLQKQNLNLPSLPMLGQAGTIGVAAFLLSNGGRNKLADEICTAALTIAAYELGSTGQVVGDNGFDPGGAGFVSGY
jgi:hypothetical protein